MGQTAAAPVQPLEALNSTTGFMLFLKRFFFILVVQYLSFALHPAFIIFTQLLSASQAVSQSGFPVCNPAAAWLQTE